MKLGNTTVMTMNAKGALVPAKNPLANWLHSSQASASQRSKPVGLSKTDPLVANEQTGKLVVDYIMARARVAVDANNARRKQMEHTDRQLYSQPLPLNGKKPEDDEDRSKVEHYHDLLMGRTGKPIKRNYGFAVDALDGLTAYMMSLIAPDMDIFSAIAPPDKQVLANVVAAELNREGARAQHYTQLAAHVNSALRYNFAVSAVLWEEHKGRVLQAQAGGIVQPTDGIAWRGNVVQNLDPYNTFYDPSTPIDKLAQNGEFFGWVEQVSRFRARRLEQLGLLSWTDRYAQSDDNSSRPELSLYKTPPQTQDMFKEVRNSWDSYFGSTTTDSMAGIELAHFIGWIDPVLFKGVSLDGSVPGTLELWHFIVANGMYLTKAEKLLDVHGMLPVITAAPELDSGQRRLPSTTERYLPFSQFASFLLNSHVDAVSKALGQITLFDPSRIPLGVLPKGDLTNAKIPVKRGTSSENVNDALSQIADVPINTNYMQTIQEVLQLGTLAIPNDMNKQMADLNRATRFQAAAVAQGGNQRNLYKARVIYAQSFSLMSIMMSMNVMVNKPQLVYTNPQDGTKATASSSELLGQNIEFAVGTGIKGIDRLILLDTISDLLSKIVQSPQASQRFDMVRLFDWYASICGERTDLTQFTLPLQQQQAIAQAGQAQAPVAQASAQGQVPPDVQQAQQQAQQYNAMANILAQQGGQQ